MAFLIAYLMLVDRDIPGDLLPDGFPAVLLGSRAYGAPAVARRRHDRASLRSEGPAARRAVSAVRRGRRGGTIGLLITFLVSVGRNTRASCIERSRCDERRQVCDVFAVGAAGFVAQLTALWVLTERFGLHYLLSTALATELALLLNFFGHESWTWSDRPAGPARSDARRLWRFHGANGFISLSGGLMIMPFLVDAAGCIS